MIENEDILFDTVTQPLNFGSIAGTNTSNNFEEEKIYNSLYDELIDKCCPDNFCLSASFDEERFDIANNIYTELLANPCISDIELMKLRNEAIKRLGIQFSTRKLYNTLKEYFDPKIYTSIEPHNPERIRMASYFNAKILKARNNILLLEEIEKEATDFIKERQIELEYELQLKKEREKKEAVDAVDIFFVIVGILLLLGVFLSVIFIL
jgi:hypothetical protein